jgi:hypothetical protein
MGLMVIRVFEDIVATDSTNQKWDGSGNSDREHKNYTDSFFRNLFIMPDCEVPDCGKPGADFHHLIYANKKNNTKAWGFYLCPPHHKLVTKTAFMKTMEFVFEDRWREYKEYLRQHTGE